MSHSNTNEMGWQAGNSGKRCSSSPKAVFCRILVLFGEVSFCSVKISTDCMRPTPIMESNLLYSKSLNLNVNLIQKSLHRSIQNNI